MTIQRSHLRSIARTLVCALLFGQLAIAAYACPGLAMASGSSVGAVQAAAVDAAQDAAMPDCDDAMGAMDPASANLCAEHCKHGQQSDQAPTLSVPAAAPAPWYRVPAVSEPTPAPRPPARWISALVAASPPHAIAHCVFRT